MSVIDPLAPVVGPLAPPSTVPTGQSEEDDYLSQFNIDRFQTLLDKLEGSKGRQKRQESLESRRNIFAQGLASMMSNF